MIKSILGNDSGCRHYKRFTVCESQRLAFLPRFKNQFYNGLSSRLIKAYNQFVCGWVKAVTRKIAGRYLTFGWVSSQTLVSLCEVTITTVLIYM